MNGWESTSAEHRATAESLAASFKPPVRSAVKMAVQNAHETLSCKHPGGEFDPTAVRLDGP